MSGCPFGFGQQHSPTDDTQDKTDALKSGSAGVKEPSKCPFSGATTGAEDDRFDYSKDPISWFYQNQIKSEEQFQAKKAELRAAARERLENIFEDKGKHLIIDSDDDFSIATSELSAWDSEVHSIRTLASCANSWAESANFKAPALLTLRLLLLVTMATSCWSGWKAVQALTQVNRFLGVITIGWVPVASLGASSMTVVMAMLLWHTTESKSKPGLLIGQVVMQVLCAGCSLLAMLCWLHPSKMDPKFHDSLCSGHGPHASDSTSRLCHYLPVVREQIEVAISTIMLWDACLALVTLGVACAGSWHLWELAYVEKKAAKHKRRRKHRKNSIPWDKIKVEDMGPISYCGAAAPAKAASTATAKCDVKKKV